jgi:hypothetical protein
MKTISELRTSLSFSPHEINSQIQYFAERVKIDFDVYLPTKHMNLQRDFVWNIDQKRELIWSILMNRNIPRMAMMNVLVDKNDIDGTYQVIDGKQRLSTMIDFYKNKFSLEIDNNFYYFNQLPVDYQNVIKGYHFAYYIANEPYTQAFTDKDKIDWFMYINFAGTQQDAEHFKLLR